ncbi:bola domain protein [Pleomassaria siparia CBS 279.74]|uniref:Bola domain protein n=1 Tax=Pleomassaria siparia CBS 279.74 TaxID=1314801 RepID=A0A6G1JWH4_9PLEO|nr:bola domain protein [Pleomassaria siparia CBS 279.74]
MFLPRASIAGKRFVSVSSMSQSQSRTPLEDAIRAKVTEALKPTTLEIHNDSHLHAHHKAMEGVMSKETHFRLIITSQAFASKPLLARQRMVNTLLKEELAKEGGIHALQLKTRTPEEEKKLADKEGA